MRFLEENPPIKDILDELYNSLSLDQFLSEEEISSLTPFEVDILRAYLVSRDAPEFLQKLASIVKAHNMSPFDATSFLVSPRTQEILARIDTGWSILLENNLAKWLYSLTYAYTKVILEDNVAPKQDVVNFIRLLHEIYKTIKKRQRSFEDWRE